MRAIIALLLALVVSGAGANEQPPAELRGQTITVMVPYAAGGASDLISRQLASRVKTISGLNIVVVNRPGAQATIGTREVAQAQPNALTLLASDNAGVVMNPLMQPVGWVPRERFQTITITAISLQGIYVAQASPHRTLQDLLAAKDLRYGCATSVCNLFIERILAHKRVEAIAVAYKSTPQVIMDLASGQTDFIGVSSFDALPMVQAGMVRPLAFGTEQPMDFYPQIGLFRDVVPGFVAVNFHGLYAPQGTPQHLVDYLNRVYRLALNDPEIREQFKSKTLGLWDGTATQAERYVDRHVQIWRPIVERHYKP